MASATVGVLRVLLTANGSEFEAAMKKAQGAAQAWSKDLESIGRQATALGASLTKTVTLPIIAALGGAAKAAMDFESDFANVAKTVDGVSDAAGKLTPKGQALAQTFRQMAKEIPATTAELTAIAALGGQMGVPIEQLEHFTRNVAALGVAVDGISTEEAAAGLAQIGNITGTGTKNVQQMASALVHLGNSSNATEADILEFSKRLAGAGHAVGMTVPEIMALGTAMANVGINAEAGGTAMSTMISKMSIAVSEGGASLKAFDEIVQHTGKSFTELWKGNPTEAINAVVVGLGHAKASGQDLNAVVKDIGATNIRTADTMKRLAGAGDSIAVSLKTANEGFSSGNKHLEEAQKKYATTENQLKMLWSSIKDVGIILGNSLLPAIQAGIQLVGAFIPVIDKLAAGFTMLPGGMQLVALGIAGVAAASGPLIFAFGQLALASAAVTKAFTAKGLASRILFADMAMVTTAVRAQTVAMAASVTTHGALGAAAITLTGAVRGLWAVIAAHPFTALTIAVGAATAALVHFYAASKEQALAAETAGAKQDVLNRATKEAGRVITDYTEAIKINQAAQDIRAAKFDQSTEAQRKRIEAEMLLGKITQEQYRSELVALSAVQAGNDVRSKRISITDSLAAQEAKVRNEIEATGYTMAQLLGHLKSNEQGFKGWAKEVGLSAETLSFLEGKLKGNAKAQKEFEKEQTASEKAAEALNKRLEKQAAALEKLGIVTENEVLKQLGQFNELIVMAVEAGVPLDKVLSALAPRMEELRKKAQDSGVSMETFADALDQATDAAKKLLSELADKMPRAVTGLKTIPGTVVDLSNVLNTAAIQAQNTADSFAFFGIQTRQQLERTARDAVAHYATIKASGIATPEAIQEAFEKMNEALRLAGMQTKDDWGQVCIGILGDIERTFDGVVGVIAGAIGRIRAAFKSLKGMSRSERIGAGISAGLDVYAGTGLEGQSTGESTISGIGSGAMSGMALGSIVPGLGTIAGGIIGGVVGGVVGFFRGRDANNQHKKANDARDEYLEQFGDPGTGQGSGFANLAKQLNTLGPMGDALFKNIVNAKTVKDLEKAIANAEQAMDSFRGEMSRLAQEGGVAGVAMTRFRDRTRETAETLAFIRSEAITAANSIGSFLKVANFSSQAAASAGTDLIAASFAELRAQGMTTRQALAELGPTILLAKEKLAEAGMTGSAAFNDIARFASIAADEVAGPLLDGIGHLTRGLEAAHNAGMLTQSMFAGLTGEIMVQRQALLDLGHSSEDVNRLMQRDLQTIWQLQKDFGYVVDDSTQALLDEAEASGIVGDKFRSAMDRAAIAMEKAANAIIKAFGGVGAEAEKTGRTIDDAFRDRTVTVRYDEQGRPDLDGAAPDTGAGPDFAAAGGLVTRHGVMRFARGGFVPRGTDTQPAMLTPGEIVMNEAQQGRIGESLRAAMEAASGAFHAPSRWMDSLGASFGTGQGIQSTTIMQVDKRELGRAVADVLPGELRRLGVRVRS